jgi:cell wall-associated NlpC family hydrolase
MTTRAAVVDEARSWLRTPWHHMGRVKAAGVDCAQLLCAVYHATGFVPEIDLGYYPPDWHLHQDRPRFLEELAKYSDVIDGPPLPGDVAMFKFGRHAAHGSIVIGWPLIIHAYVNERMVVITDAVAHADLAARLGGFWRVRGLA